MQARHIRKSIVGALISPHDFFSYSFMQHEALLSRQQCPTYNLVFRPDNITLLSLISTWRRMQMNETQLLFRVKQCYG